MYVICLCGLEVSVSYRGDCCSCGNTLNLSGEREVRKKILRDKAL